MLIVLGQLDVGLHPALVADHHGLPDLPGLVLIPRPAVASGQAQLTGGLHLPRGQPVAPPRLLGMLHPLQRHPHGEHVLPEGHLLRMLVEPGHMAEHHAQAGDILGVVFDHVPQKVELPGLQVAEVPLGHLTAGDVVRAAHPQHRFLQPAQIAPVQPQLPHPPGHVQQINVGQFQAGGAHPVHQEPIPQKRHVEAAPVEGADHVRVVQLPGHLLQQEPFLRIVPHQVLPHREALIRQPPHAHQERHRPRPREARGLRVQVQDPPGIEILRHGLPLHEHHRPPHEAKGMGEFLHVTILRPFPAGGVLPDRGGGFGGLGLNGPQLVPQIHGRHLTSAAPEGG